MNDSRRWSLALLSIAMLVVAACGGGGDESAPAPAADAAPAAPAAAGSATVSGTVQAAGADDPDTDLKMDADPVCAGLHDSTVQSETLVVDDSGNLKNALVYVKTGLKGKSFAAPSDAAMLAQNGCVYTPHVGGAMVGQTLKVVNQDPTLHNVHATPAENREFNQAQPFQGMELERTFENAEIVPFKCDVHPWMSAYLGVFDHPFFAVTGADGSFSIDGLPAGSYTLEAWHEVLGTATAEATVEDGGSASVSFNFGG